MTKASELYRMIKEGKRVEIERVSPPLQMAFYKANGEKNKI